MLKVSVNHTRRLRRSGTNQHSPSSHFLHTSGEIGLQAQQLEGGADQAVRPGSSMPMSSRKAFLSSSSRLAISDSVAAEMGCECIHNIDIIPNAVTNKLNILSTDYFDTALFCNGAVCRIFS